EQISLFDLNHPESSPRTVASAEATHLQCAFQPSEKYIATSDSDGVVRVWDIETGKIARTFRGHSAASRTLTFLDDRRLVSGSDDSSIRVWNLLQGPLDPDRTWARGESG